MMTKTKPITSWQSYNQKDYINGEWNIDWPRVHRELGRECWDWLLEQEKKGRLYLIVEKQERRMRLSAVFKDSKIESEYALMSNISIK